MQSDLHSRQRKIRRDPLYRVSDVNRWIIEAESVFSDELNRLQDINKLGIIPVVDRKMPTYSKYEHAFGTVHQIVNLLRIWLSLIHISEPTRQAEISYAVFCL